MKQKLLQSLMFIALLLTSTQALAYDFEAQNSDGVTIYYKITSTTDKTCEVTKSRYYTEILLIPETVVYNGISYSVTSIGDFAFYNCSGLTSITIPNSVTSIGFCAFTDCTGLTSITIPNSVTSIDDKAFYGCSGLTTIKVETGNSKYDSRNNCNAIIETESNTLIVGCMNTNIPNSVTSIDDYAFFVCRGLTSITIPNSVTSIGVSAFYDCTGLTSITIPNSVTSIGVSAFYGCSGLTSISIPNSVTSIGKNAFYDTGWYNKQPDGILYLDNCCLGYKGNAPTGKLTLVDGTRLIAENAFRSCTGMTSVTIPNSVTSIGNLAFDDCTGLTSVTIPNSVTSIGNYTFYDTGWYNNQPDGILYLDNCCLGYKGNAPTGKLTLVDGTRLIAENAFRSCTGMTSVTIPNSVTSIGNFAFLYCTGLTSFTIPNSVTSIGNDAFYKCTGLTSITIGAKVSTIGRCAFYEDYNIRTITCKAKTPPTCVSNVFESVIIESVPLTVPKESVSLYQTADTWLDFYIMGAEFSGIEEKLVDDNENTPAVYYNLQGVKVENPSSGLYIKRQGGKTSKVIL